MEPPRDSVELTVSRLDGDPSLAPPPGERGPRHWGRVSLTLLSLLGLALVVGGGYAITHQVDRPSPPAATPNTTLVNVSGYAGANVTDTTIAVNGRNFPPNYAITFTPTLGKTTFRFTAPAFQPLTCVLTILSAYNINQTTSIQGDNCAMQSGGDSRGNQTLTVLAIFTPSLLLDRAAVATVTSLVADATPTLATTLTVPTGQWYASAYDGSNAVPRQATQPLTATFAHGVIISGYQNSLFATALPPTDHVWLLAVAYTDHWTFATAAGVVMGDAIEPDVGGVSTLALRYSTTGAFTLASDITAALPSLSHYSFSLCTDGFIGALQVSFGQATIADKQLAGCELAISLTNPAPGTTVDPATDPTAGRFLARFGVWLAINGPARQAAPSLPVAPAAEVQTIGG